VGTRQLKKEVLQLLLQPELEKVLSGISKFPAKETVNALFSAICHHDKTLRWHGISGMGMTVARLAEENMEEGRIIMRRFLWSLNDESGGIGWGAPESMAESMHHHQGLAKEYIHMLISYTRPDGEELAQDGNFLEHEVLQRGVLWGLNRLCERRKELLIEKGYPDNILFYLDSDDMEVCASAVRLCGSLRIQSARDKLSALVNNSSKISIYEEGNLMDFTVGNLAEEALKELQA
jgi:hypothetical protein